MSDLTPDQRMALYEGLPDASKQALVAMLVKQKWLPSEIGRQLDPAQGNPELMTGQDGKILPELRRLYPGREYQAWFDHHDMSVVSARAEQLRTIGLGWRRKANRLADICHNNGIDTSEVPAHDAEMSDSE